MQCIVEACFWHGIKKGLEYLFHDYEFITGLKIYKFDVKKTKQQLNSPKHLLFYFLFQSSTVLYNKTYHTEVPQCSALNLTDPVTLMNITSAILFSWPFIWFDCPTKQYFQICKITGCH